MKKSILAVGSLAFDSIKTPAGAVDKALGGSANYFSISASFFSPVQLVGVVGDDFPQSHLDFLKKHKIDLRGIQKVPGKTFHWAGEYGLDLNQAITLSTQLNVFEHFQPKIPQEYCDTNYLFLGNIAPSLQMLVLNQVKKPKMVIMDTMNFWITGAKEDLLNVLPRIDLLTINEGEVKLLGNNNNTIVASENVMKLGPKALIVKQGEYGAFLFFGKKIFSAPALPIRKIVDPTGAGDTFAGGLVGYLAKTGSGLNFTTLKKAVLHGAVMASFTVEDFSFNRLKKLKSAEITKRYRDLLSIMHV